MPVVPMLRRARTRTTPVGVRATRAVLLAVAALALLAPGALAVSGAVSTTDDPGFLDSGGSYTDQACTNGNGVNCNIYLDKRDVWLSGLPVASALNAGTYFFAVLAPGGQANPNDAGANNLSDTFTQPWPLASFNGDSSSIPSGDDWTNREFTVDGQGNITSYLGTHHADGNKLQVFPYDDTTNPGDEYILAVCQVPATAGSTTGAGTPGVKASDCKYDGFKVQTQAPVTCDPNADPTCVPPPADDLFVTKDAAGTNKNTYTWTIQKDVDHTKITDSSGSATFNYTVTVTHDGGAISDVQVNGTIQVFNPNQDSLGNTVPVDITSVTDQLSNAKNCLVTGGTATQTLSAFETDFPYTCDLGSSLPSGELDNTVTVTWPVQNLINGTHLAANSSDFTFSNITFTETPIDNCVTISDPLAPAGTFPASPGQCVGGLSPAIYNYSNTVTGTPGTCVSQDNTATFTTNTTSTPGSAKQSVQYCDAEDLGVTKGATPTFTRTYTWGIAKKASQTVVKQLSGTKTITYTVTVTQAGHTDTGWTAAGTITLTNPNDFEDITGVNVTDAVSDGTTCTVTGGTGVTVPKSRSVPLSYTCSWTSASPPTYNTDLTNTATANWDSGLGTPTTTGSGSAKFQFNTGPTTAPTAGNPMEVDKCVTVTDTFAGKLGTDCVGVDTATKTFSYNRTFTIAANTCTTYPNTASLNDTAGDSASQSVQVCGGVAGGLTMGFWQNKNGQGIIAGQSKTGTCPSVAYLRQFSPFTDLSSTATCGAVGSTSNSNVVGYVYNVVKAATCGTTTCNYMLKAQMLATALDVYFSGSTSTSCGSTTVFCGGDAIASSNGGNTAFLGGVKVDLTSVCNMTDGATSSTCSGTYQNVSAEFGGATCETVLQALQYQNTTGTQTTPQAFMPNVNLGGSPGTTASAGISSWYGLGSAGVATGDTSSLNKSSQVMAKNLYDATNNQQAFTC